MDLDFINITPENGALQDIRELIFLQTIEAADITRFHVFNPGVLNGQKVGFIGEVGPVGKVGTGCNPTYGKTLIPATEKEWALGDWEIAEGICYADVKDTLVRHAMRTKTEVADLTGTDYLTVVVEPVMKGALRKMLWRLLWFGDIDAKNVTSGGIIKDGVDTNLFKVADGFFKKINAIIAGNPAQRISVPANAQATYATQISAFTDAKSVLESLITKADLLLRQSDDTLIMMTQSFADVFDANISAMSLAVDAQWELLVNGIKKLHWKGVDMYAVPVWDEFIRTFEDNGTKWNNPHRALLTTGKTLNFGSPATDSIGDLQTWFDRKDQMNYMLAKDELGTLIPDDRLVQFAV
jgi:hypothetical protein